MDISLLVHDYKPTAAKDARLNTPQTNESTQHRYEHPYGHQTEHQAEHRYGYPNGHRYGYPNGHRYGYPYELQYAHPYAHQAEPQYGHPYAHPDENPAKRQRLSAPYSRASSVWLSDTDRRDSYGTNATTSASSPADTPRGSEALPDSEATSGPQPVGDDRSRTGGPTQRASSIYSLLSSSSSSALTHLSHTPSLPPPPAHAPPPPRPQHDQETAAGLTPGKKRRGPALRPEERRVKAWLDERRAELARVYRTQDMSTVRPEPMPPSASAAPAGASAFLQYMAWTYLEDIEDVRIQKFLRESVMTEDDYKSLLACHKKAVEGLTRVTVVIPPRNAVAFPNKASSSARRG